VLAQIDRLKDRVLHLTDHVLRALELAVSQSNLDLVKFAHGFVEQDELVGLLDCHHKVGVQARALHRLNQVCALLHYGAVNLDAA